MLCAAISKCIFLSSFQRPPVSLFCPMERSLRLSGAEQPSTAIGQQRLDGHHPLRFADDRMAAADRHTLASSRPCPQSSVQTNTILQHHESPLISAFCSCLRALAPLHTIALSSQQIGKSPSHSQQRAPLLPPPPLPHHRTNSKNL